MINSITRENIDSNLITLGVLLQKPHRVWIIYAVEAFLLFIHANGALKLELQVTLYTFYIQNSFFCFGSSDRYFHRFAQDFGHEYSTRMTWNKLQVWAKF